MDPAPGPGRRSVLRLGAAGALTGVAFGPAGGAWAAPAPSPTPSPAAAPAAPATDADTLVLVTLRGGADALTIVPPIGDDLYTRARPTLAVPAAAARKVDDTFRLHPALAPLFPLWDAGRLAAVHAVGMPTPTHSHAAALDALERAGGTGGWLGRALGAAAGGLAGVHVGGAVPPAVLAGARPAFGLTDLASTGLPAVPGPAVGAAAWQAALRGLGTPTPAVNALITALAIGDQLGKVRTASVPRPQGYPATPLGDALHEVAQLVRAGVGVRAATVEDDGWDLHTGAGTADAGPQADRIRHLASALFGFAKELGPDLDRVVVVVVSEFGRRTVENGAGGTDHGHGGVVLLLGGSVKGRQVHGRWPGLAPGTPGTPGAGDLAVTTDVRHVLAQVLTRRCGVATTDVVFPDLPAPSAPPPDVVEAR